MPNTTRKPKSVMQRLALLAAKAVGSNYKLGKIFGVAHAKFSNISKNTTEAPIENFRLKTLIELTYVNGIQLVPVSVIDNQPPQTQELINDLGDAFIELYANMPELNPTNVQPATKDQIPKGTSTSSADPHAQEVEQPASQPQGQG